MTTGLTGKLRDDFLYPYQLFFDIGCGLTVLEFDDLPNNVNELLADLDLSGFCDEEIESAFPSEMKALKNTITVEEIRALLERESQKPHDDYIRLMLDGFTNQFEKSSLMRDTVSSLVKDGSDFRLLKYQGVQSGEVFSFKWNTR